MLAGNSSISLNPILIPEKLTSASSDQPATQTSSSLYSTSPTATEITGCSLLVSSVSISDKELLPPAETSYEKSINSSFCIETGEEKTRELGPATKKAKVDNFSSQHLEPDITMKGDVAAAPMPSVTEARSPMINIPVGIVKEFMSANSPLAADANRGTKSSKPTSNGTVPATLQDTSAIDANGEHSNDGSVGSTSSRSSIKSNKSTKSAKSVLSNGTQSPITCNGVSSPRSHTPVNNSNNANPGLSSKSPSPVVTFSSTSVTSQLTAAASVLASTISTSKATETPTASSTLSTTSTVTPMDTSVSVPTITNSRSKSELRNFKHLSATLGVEETTANNSTRSTNGFSNSEDSALDPLNNSSDMLPDLSGNTPLSVFPLKTSAPLDTPVSTVDSVLPVLSDVTEAAPFSALAQPVSASSPTLPASTAVNSTALPNLLQNLDVRNGLLAGGKENSLVGDINGLKRSLDSDNASNDTKKQRLSPLQDSATTDVSFGNSLPLIKDDASGNDSKMLLDAEVESLKKTASKLHKLKRMDLENLILDLFMSKLLHNHELGRYKTLCEKLEATLEANRKKTAQFHKEMDDLRKVTKRLREEHQARKEQLITPIKIKRSVGIQAAPHIIQKGLALAHTAQATITPKMCRVGGPSGMQLSPGANGLTSMSSPLTGSQQMMLFNSQPSSGASPSSTHDVSLANTSSFMRTSAGGVRLGLVSSSPSTLMVSSPSTAATSNSAGADVTRCSFFPSQPLTSQANNVSANGGGLFTAAGNSSGYSGGIQSSRATGKGASVIDLTDEEEGRAPLKAPQQTLVKMVPNSASFVTLPVQSGSGMTAGGAQYVLVPNTVGSSTIMVSNMANNAATVTVAGGTPNLSLTSSATRLLVTAGLSTPKPSPLTAPAPSIVNSLPQHPAPLPRTAPQQVVGGAMQLPPQPTLKLSHKANSIVLSWTMAKTIEHEAIASYQLYAYQESSQTPSPSLWKKVGSVKALELPMACTLTQFMPGHRYHFAVRAVDAKSRLGPFSDPRSIRLEK